MTSTHNHDRQERSGFGSGMFMGIVLGSVVGYFLTTDQGKEILSGLSGKAKGKLDELKQDENVVEAFEVIQEKVAQVKEVVSEAASQVAEKTSEPEKSKPRLFKRSGTTLKS